MSEQQQPFITAEKVGDSLYFRMGGPGLNTLTAVLTLPQALEMAAGLVAAVQGPSSSDYLDRMLEEWSDGQSES